MTMQEDIVRTLQQAQAEIQANMASKNINASGRSSRAFVVRVLPTSVQLAYGSSDYIAPLDTLEIGRPAGRVPGGFSLTRAKTGKYAGKLDVSNKFKYILILWGKEKGIDLGWGGATELGRKIAYDGTDRHRNPVDVWSTPVEKAVSTLRTNVRVAIGSEIHQLVTTNF